MPTALRLADLRRPPAGAGRGLRGAGARSRRRDARQDGHHGVRAARIRADHATRTIPRTRRAARRAARPPRSPTAWCRSRFGTQTGGSIIRPASYCGVVGYKPSFGTINPTGVKPLAESFDTVGLFARSVDDFALVAACSRARSPRAADRPALRPARVGLCRTPAGSSAEAADRRAAVETAAVRSPARASPSTRSSCRADFDAVQRLRKRRAALRGGAHLRVRTDAARRRSLAVEPRGVRGRRRDRAARLSRSAGLHRASAAGCSRRSSRRSMCC